MLLWESQAEKQGRLFLIRIFFLFANDDNFS